MKKTLLVLCFFLASISCYSQRKADRFEIINNTEFEDTTSFNREILIDYVNNKIMLLDKTYVMQYGAMQYYDYHWNRIIMYSVKSDSDFGYIRLVLKDDDSTWLYVDMNTFTLRYRIEKIKE